MHGFQGNNVIICGVSGWSIEKAAEDTVEGVADELKTSMAFLWQVGITEEVMDCVFPPAVLRFPPQTLRFTIGVFNACSAR